LGYKFSYNGTSHELYSSTAKITSPSFAYRRDGSTYYVPLLTSRSQTIGDYKYDASYPTRCVRYNNTTYYAAKSRTVNYDIPDGTYDPLVFEKLIDDYIGLNSGRWAWVGSGLFKVNNQIKQIVNEEGKCFIYYGSTSSGSGLSSGEYRFVAFTSSSSNLIYPEVQDLTNFRGIYIVKGTHPFQTYSSFPITMFGGTSIKFV
jgi:hypothetical protein